MIEIVIDVADPGTLDLWSAVGELAERLPAMVSARKGGRAEGLSGLEVHFARSRRQRAASAAIAS